MTVTGTLLWTSGYLLGTGRTIIAAGATATFGGTGVKGFTRTFDNVGTVDYPGAGLQFAQEAADTTFNNLAGGVFNVTGAGCFNRNTPGTHAFNNAGTFNKSGAGTLTSFNGVAFNNSADLGVTAGDLELNGGRIDFPGASVLQTALGATLRLSGSSLTGATTNSARWATAGRLLFSGGGTQTLEAMSRDMGNTPAGYINNFAYNTLELAGGANVMLVNEADNGPDSAALYVHTLLVPAGCTLNLGGLKVYARVTQILGTATGGTIAVPPNDNGPIALNATKPSALALAGEEDEWTFYGRAGQAMTVAVDTGGGTVLSPQLGFVEVRVLDAQGTLLARGSNTVVRQTVVLSDVAMPEDGTYRIQVRAPATQPASSGNYLVTVWEVTPEVMPLPFNQRVNGRIETPYSVDRWTFFAVAGQQVRFDWVNASAAGVAFSLRGPDGPLGFANLVADSGLVNLPADGGYSIRAFGTGGAYAIDYAFQLIETTQMPLAIGDTFTGQFNSSGQAQIFVFDGNEQRAAARRARGRRRGESRGALCRSRHAADSRDVRLQFRFRAGREPRAPDFQRLSRAAVFARVCRPHRVTRGVHPASDLLGSVSHRHRPGAPSQQRTLDHDAHGSWF